MSTTSTTTPRKEIYQWTLHPYLASASSSCGSQTETSDTQEQSRSGSTAQHRDDKAQRSRAGLRICIHHLDLSHKACTPGCVVCCKTSRQCAVARVPRGAQFHFTTIISHSQHMLCTTTQNTTHTMNYVHRSLSEPCCDLRSCAQYVLWVSNDGDEVQLCWVVIRNTSSKTFWILYKSVRDPGGVHFILFTTWYSATFAVI